MLFLTCKPDQAIQIGDNIIVDARSRNGRAMPIKFGIAAPREIPVRIIAKPKPPEKGHADFVKDIEGKT